MMNDTNVPLSSGVQALIDKIRNEGVVTAREEARTLLDEARSHAERIVVAARLEADATLADAKESARAEREAACSAVDIALRDAQLVFKEKVTFEFSNRLQGLVAQKLAEPDTIGVLLQEIVKQSEISRRNDLDEIVLASVGRGKGGAPADDSRLAELDQLIGQLFTDCVPEAVPVATVS